jgi:hypothetical protein
MVPDGWEEVPLFEIISRLEAGVSVPSDDRPATGPETGVLKVSSVAPGRFKAAENKFVRVMYSLAERILTIL